MTEDEVSEGVKEAGEERSLSVAAVEQALTFRLRDLDLKKN